MGIGVIIENGAIFRALFSDYSPIAAKNLIAENDLWDEEKSKANDFFELVVFKRFKVRY